MRSPGCRAFLRSPSEGRSRRPRVIECLTLFALALLTALPASSVTLPTGFSQSQVGGSLKSPTAFAIAPDGRIFVCEQAGKLRVIKNGSLLSTPFLSVTVDSAGERGLLGVAFDPAFGANGYVYVYYTTATAPKHNRLSRFTASGTTGDVAVAGSELVLLELDNLSSATNHNGGATHFGLDGKLYVAVGENATGSNAQTTANLLGKLLRLNPNGSIPTDNPFYGSASGKNRAIWALGLRNPFTFAIHPVSGRIFINDVGLSTWEEIDDGFAGRNYGWPTTEGDTTDPRFEAPVFAYGHGSDATHGCAIVGGAFYRPATVQFPSSYLDDYFFADYCSGWIRFLDSAGGYSAASGFATGVSVPVGLAVAPDGSLYYLARGQSSSAGGVYRIQYTLNTPPTITVHPSNQIVTVGDPVTFSVSASGTPPLSYQWQRNSTNISGATSSSYTISSAQNADNGAVFRCVVSNAYGNKTSNGATLTVTPNLAPVATITLPTAGTTYAGGNTINYAGTGTDPEDGALPASAFTWEIVLHHDTHTHPFIAPFSGVKSGSFVVPTTGHTEDNVWYRIHLTVTDSDGLTNSVYTDVVPRKTTMTFATNPPGLQVTLDGQPLTTPATVVGVEGIVRTLGVVSPQSLGGVTYTFASWSDGGAATHDVSTPVPDTTYTATFVGPTPTATRTFTRTPTRTNTPVPPTSTPTRTYTRTPTRTNTPVPPTSTPTRTYTRTPTRTNTPVPSTATRTNTPVPPTSTPTRTYTRTATRTNTPVPSTATRTNTPVPPTSTPTRTYTRTPTRTNTPVPSTATRTNTPVPPTSTPTRTYTRTPTRTNTPVPPTSTPTRTYTRTPTRTNTPVPSTATRTNTPVPPTSTPTRTYTRTPTRTNTPVPPTSTPTRTNTPVPPTATPSGPTPIPLTPSILGMTPDSGPASGAMLVTLTGSNFVSGATVRIGGAIATGVNVSSPTQILLTPPALPPGTLHDIVVQNPGGGSASKTKVWFADFRDVPHTDLIEPAVEKLVRNGVTSGCGGGNYCPALSLTRAEAAKFLLKSKHGAAYVPPPPKGTVFLDVPKSDPFAGWIEQLWAEGISGGCGAGNFCGSATLNRATLAVLLLKATRGAAYRPPAAIGMFSDVPATNIYAGWIEQLYRDGITSGCGASLFCPAKLASRGEMALFLVRGFALP